MKRVPSAITPIIAVSRKSSAPLHRQIYDSFRDLIVQGNLVSGQQIPSTRTLAKELGISRFPVLNAYAQLLAEGYFEGRTGSGTVVSSSLPDQPTLPGPPGGRSTPIFSGPRQSSKISAQLPGVKSEPWLHGRAAFVGSQLALDHFPFNLWSRLLAFRCGRIAEASLHYGHPMGLRDLREAIVNYLKTARAVRCDAEQIMIVSGSQQALDITSRILLDPKDRVWLEEPGYILARHIFMMAGSRVVPVPVDQEGLDVAAGKKFCGKAKAVYVCPRHIRRMRAIYHERRNALVASLRKDLAGTLKVLAGGAGLHLTVMLKEQESDVAISARAALQNLWLWPLSICYLGPVPRQGFILGFGGIPVDEIPSAVRRLRAVLQEK